MARTDRPLVWLHSEIKTPPFSPEARVEAGLLLRRLQRGDMLALPHARLMPGIGQRCLELRIPDREHTWRVICRLDQDAVIIADVFSKKTQATPKYVIETCRRRLRQYDQDIGG